MDKNSKVQELKNKVNEKTKELKTKVNQKENKKVEKPILTTRILFISVLNFIYIAVLIILLVVGLVNINWNPKDMIIDFAGYIVLYLILNWFYRCLSRTILCLTNKRVYLELHLPFYYNEITIPVEKVTKVETVTFFWIFRTLIIHQYGALPLIFATWDNNTFKDKLEEMITAENYRVENKYDENNLLSKNAIKYVIYAFLVLFVIGCIITGVKKVSDPSKKVPGTYLNDEYKLVIEKDGTCNMTGVEQIINRKNTKDCNWELIVDEDNYTLKLNYKYVYESYYNNYDYNGSTNLDYSKKDKTLTLNNIVLKKK